MPKLFCCYSIPITELLTEQLWKLTEELNQYSLMSLLYLITVQSDDWTRLCLYKYIILHTIYIYSTYIISPFSHLIYSLCLKLMLLHHGNYNDTIRRAKYIRIYLKKKNHILKRLLNDNTDGILKISGFHQHLGVPHLSSHRALEDSFCRILLQQRVHPAWIIENLIIYSPVNLCTSAQWNPNCA